jgi:hypothetical protein
MMILTRTSPVAVYHSLKGSKNPRSRYCSTISGHVSVVNFVYMMPSTAAPSATTKDEDTATLKDEDAMSKMLFRF